MTKLVNKTIIFLKNVHFQTCFWNPLLMAAQKWSLCLKFQNLTIWNKIVHTLYGQKSPDNFNFRNFVEYLRIWWTLYFIMNFWSWRQLYIYPPSHCKIKYSRWSITELQQIIMKLLLNVWFYLCKTCIFMEI